MGLGGSGSPPLSGQQCIDRIITVSDYADQLGIGGSGSRTFHKYVQYYDLEVTTTDQVVITGMPAKWMMVGMKAFNQLGSGTGPISVYDFPALAGNAFYFERGFDGLTPSSYEVKALAVEAGLDAIWSEEDSVYISTITGSGFAGIVDMLFEFVDLSP